MGIQKRSIGVSILLSIVTCGIYGYYWLACMANDTNRVSGHNGDTSGGMVVLLSIVTCNIYHIYWMYTAGSKIETEEWPFFSEQCDSVSAFDPVWAIHRRVGAPSEGTEQPGRGSVMRMTGFLPVIPL